ncbi:DoxX family protein [Aquamicrobium sp. LC103]|uniref:DoxX family protein n=1 Tax=Aquamicrobium sp. LC103 TaxID=1120658 RepID=UPI00063EAEE1|nr:DoxX family protein [Aquamicrobium sp. LC103]TKT69168.1 DoxX family protein [Aquamicrobium sp. LC103]
MSSSVITLIGRILLSVIFILSGFGKLVDPGTAENAMSTAGMIASKGLPASVFLAYVVGLVELLGGLAVLAGFFTSAAAWVLALFCIASGLMFHVGATGDPTMDAINPAMLMKNLAMAGGLLVLAVAGPGSISVDARRD